METDGKFLVPWKRAEQTMGLMSFNFAESCFKVGEPCLSVVDHRAEC